MIHLFYSLALLILLNSCAARLNVQTNYLTQENLASYYVDTPDPNLCTPLVGQRLFISWSLSPCDLTKDHLTLHIRIRFRNRQEEELFIPIKHCGKNGYYLYDVVSAHYCKTGGIATYKVEIKADNYIVEKWTHPLWAELIKFDIPKIETSKETLIKKSS